MSAACIEALQLVRANGDWDENGLARTQGVDDGVFEDQGGTPHNYATTWACIWET